MEQLSEGLCSVRTAWYLENGEREADRLLQEAMLERRGVGAEDYERYLDYQDYRHWKARQSILHYITYEKMVRAEELLELSLRKLLRLAGGLGREKTPDALAICVEALDRTLANLFMNLGQKLGIPAKQLLLLNRRECFYYFVYHQNKELWLHDVMLYDYRGTRMLC